MLKIVKPVKAIQAKNAEFGNVQTFLEHLLIEVVAGNYRHFLHERLFSSDIVTNTPEQYCWPPLLANERQVTGLFASAMSTVCPVSRTEASVVRPSDDVDGKGSAGRVDFMALYGNRYIGLELKLMRTAASEGSEYNVAQTSWKKVCVQAAHTLAHMSDQKKDFQHPVSVGLLAIRIERKVRSMDDEVDTRDDALAEVDNIVDKVRKKLKPDFLAHYEPPHEMQTFLRGSESGNVLFVYPSVIFAASVHVRRP